MVPTWHDSVLRITSSKPDNKKFGTGFVVYVDDNSTFVLTCSHVVKDVGDKYVLVAGQPADVIGTGQDDVVDIAILRINKKLTSTQLRLKVLAGEKGREFVIAGYLLLDGNYAIRPLSGEIGGEVRLEAKGLNNRIVAWDLRIEDDHTLEPGYSGSPLLDKKTNSVFGIVSHRQGRGDKGIAISIKSLLEIWPNIPDVVLKDIRVPSKRKIDWGNAPDIRNFYGRTNELALLQKWVFEDKCKVATVVGLKGMGKTDLTVKFGKDQMLDSSMPDEIKRTGVSNDFDYVIWRKLLNAPPINDLLIDLIRFFSNESETEFSSQTENLLSTLFSYVRVNRCLIILDNFDTVLGNSTEGKDFIDGFDGYGDFLKAFCDLPHPSCLMITTREKPRIISLIEGEQKSVRSLDIQGLGVDETKLIFNQISSTFSCDENHWREIATLYNGNPFAIDLAARHIKSVYSENIIEFLKNGQPIFQDVRDLLDWHFERLSHAEREILYWLAVNRRPMSLIELQRFLVSHISKRDSSSVLQNLQMRIPLERSKAGFTVQPIIIEYVTEKIIDLSANELSNSEIVFLNQHCLVMATTQDYIKETQFRLLVKPISDVITSSVGKNGFAQRLLSMLQKAQDLYQKGELSSGYLGGNIVNIILYNNFDISTYNFSNLPVWQAHFRNKQLRDVDFRYSEILNCTFTETFGSLLSVDISRDNKVMIGGGGNGEIRVWQLDTMKQLLSFRGHTDWIECVAISPDNTSFATSSSDATIKIWDINSGRNIMTLNGHTRRVKTIAYSANGDYLASGGDDYIVNLWNAKTGTLINKMQGHQGDIRQVMFSPNSKELVSVSIDQTIRIWNVETGEIIRTIKEDGPIWALSIHPEGKILATGNTNGEINIWTEGKLTQTIRGHSARIKTMLFSPDGQKIVSGSDDHSIKIWGLDGECLKTLVGHTNWIWHLAISSNGDLIVSSSEDRTVKFWDVETGFCTRTLDGYINQVWSLSFDSKGKLISSGSEDGIVRVWDVEKESVVSDLIGHQNWINCVTFNKEGNLLASGSADKTVIIWDVENAVRKDVLLGSKNWILSVAFSKDGRYIASGCEDGAILIWNLANPSEPYLVLDGHKHRVTAIEFQDDSNILLSGGTDNILKIWDLKTKTAQFLTGHSNSILSIALNRQRNRVFTGSQDKTIKLWDLDKKKCLDTLEGHNGAVSSLALNKDETYLLSGSEDQTLGIWDIKTGKALKFLRGHQGQITSVAYTPNGELVATSSDDGSIKVWDVATGDTKKTLISDRPYERMKITGIKGLTVAQRATLLNLGAIE